MLLKRQLSLLPLSLLLFSSHVQAHEEFVPEQVSVRAAETVPGLEAYEMQHFLDLPLEITSKFFFEQIINPQDLTFHTESIMNTNDEEKTEPNWVLWMTAENNPRFSCRKC